MKQGRSTVGYPFRWALRGGYLLCAVLALTFATLWIRSYFIADEIDRVWIASWPETTTLAGNPPAPATHVHNGRLSLFTQGGYISFFHQNIETLHLTPLFTTIEPFHLYWESNHTPFRAPLPASARLFHSTWFKSADWKPYDALDSFPGPATSWEKGYTDVYALPLWLLTLPFLIIASLPLSHFLPSRRRARRIAKGLCPTCTYDLRAHAPGAKCPECGTPVPVP